MNVYLRSDRLYATCASGWMLSQLMDVAGTIEWLHGPIGRIAHLLLLFLQLAMRTHPMALE